MVGIVGHIPILHILAILVMPAILHSHIPAVDMGTTEAMLLEEVLKVRLLLKTLQREM